MLKSGSEVKGQLTASAEPSTPPGQAAWGEGSRPGAPLPHHIGKGFPGNRPLSEPIRKVHRPGVWCSGGGGEKHCRLPSTKAQNPPVAYRPHHQSWQREVLPGPAGFCYFRQTPELRLCLRPPQSCGHSWILFPQPNPGAELLKGPKEKTLWKFEILSRTRLF